MHSVNKGGNVECSVESQCERKRRKPSNREGSHSVTGSITEVKVFVVHAYLSPFQNQTDLIDVVLVGTTKETYFRDVLKVKLDDDKAG